MRWRQARYLIALDENAAAYGEVVWSWRRDAGVKLATMLCIAPATVTTKPVHRGELEGNRKKHRAGKAGSIRMYLW